MRLETADQQMQRNSKRKKLLTVCIVGCAETITTHFHRLL
jgi:hypothetical protein